MAKEKALDIIKRLRDEKHQAFLAGGCVRDDLLGKVPKDYDIATDAQPGEVQRIFPQTIPLGTQFGVVLVVLEGESFAVTTFRFDGPYLDGRHPSHVRFGSMEEDIRRRDFTINGMLYDTYENRVIDLVGGEEDLRWGIVRAIGDPHQRFEEDRLRLVRAIRFAAGLRFTIEENTLKAIQGQAPCITQVAWERIGEEITRVLTEGGAKRGFELLDTTGLLGALIPVVVAIMGVEQSPENHPEGDVFTHTLGLLGHLTAPTETLAYGCLFHDIAKPPCFERRGDKITFYNHTEKGAEMAMEILKRLKRSRWVWEKVAFLVKNHLRYTQAPKMRLSTLKRFLREYAIEELLELCRIDSLSASGDLQYYDFCKQKLAELNVEEIRPTPLLRGKDLIDMGFSPGPIFHNILMQIEEGQLNSEIVSRDQALNWILKKYGDPKEERDKPETK